jgi:tetratricopeptide (TPR) repeat protein
MGEWIDLKGAIDLDDGDLLDRRHEFAMETVCPLSFAYFQALSSQSIQTAVADLELISPSLLSLFEQYLKRVDTLTQTETQQLMYVLTGLGRFWSLRGWWELSVEWRLTLFRHAEAQRWQIDPAFVAHLANALVEASRVDHSIAFGEQTLQLPNTQAHPGLISSLYLSLSSSHFSQGDYETALDYALRVLDLPLEASSMDIAHAEALLAAFDCYIALVQRDQALVAAQQAMSHAVRVADPVLVAECAVKLALGYTGTHQFDEARPLYESALAFFEALADEPKLARVEFCFAAHEYLVGSLAEAGRRAAVSLSYARRHGLTSVINEGEALLLLIEKRNSSQ